MNLKNLVLKRTPWALLKVVEKLMDLREQNIQAQYQNPSVPV